MKNIIFYICISTALINACSEPHLDTPDYEVKIAVDGFIEAGKPPIMYLSYSSPFISSYDSIDFINMVRLNVSAYVITESKDTIGFTRQTASDHYPPFKYTMSSNDITVQAGKEYKLLIRKKGMNDITASTYIPQSPPQINFIHFEPSESDSTSGLYNIQLSNSSKELYLFIQNKINSEQDYYPVQFPCKSNRYIDAHKPLDFVLKHKRKSNLWDITHTKKDSASSKPTGSYLKSDTVSFKISVISQQSFNVMSSIFLDTEFPDNPFKPASQLPQSNVSNGIGHWTGIHSQTYTINGRP